MLMVKTARHLRLRAFSEETEEKCFVFTLVINVEKNIAVRRQMTAQEGASLAKRHGSL